MAVIIIIILIILSYVRLRTIGIPLSPIPYYPQVLYVYDLITTQMGPCHATNKYLTIKQFLF